MEEIWKKIDGYNYEVSNYGNVRRIETGKILKQYKNKDGYMRVELRNMDKRKNCRVHRLVAIAFIPNPDNLPEVNHKNELKADNTVSNLEWCTPKYNNNYGTRIEKISGSNHPKAVGIYQFNKDGKLINKFETIMAAEKQFNSKTRGHICEVCQGKRKTAYGYIWKYQNTINSQKSDNTDEENKL